MICGIASYLCGGFLLSVPAIVCAHIARRRIRESHGQLGGDRMALTGLILGYINAQLTAILFVIWILLSTAPTAQP